MNRTGVASSSSSSSSSCARTWVGKRPTRTTTRSVRRRFPAPLRALRNDRSSSSSDLKGRSIEDLQAEMARLQEQIHEAHLQAHVQERRIAEELASLEVAGQRSKVLEATLGLGAEDAEKISSEARQQAGPASSSGAGQAEVAPAAEKQQQKKKSPLLRSDLKWPKELIDYWYPVEFSKNVKHEGKAVEFEVFGVKTRVTRLGSDEGPAEIRSAEDPSKIFPTHEKDGMVWGWLSDKPCPPAEEIPGFTKPPAAFREERPFTIHAELVIDVKVEHGLLLENLLDLAHAPFTHTATFAKGWSIPDLVKFNTSKILGGNWEPYPIDMSFEPPCMVLSTIGLMQPGKLEEGARASACQNHLHQLHVCLPSETGTRLLYRMSLDFMGFMLFVPFAKKIWEAMAAQVLGEDLRLVQGQEDRLRRGGDTWANPVPYDKLAVRYRKWRNSLSDWELREQQEAKLRTMSAGEMLAPVAEDEA